MMINSVPRPMYMPSVYPGSVFGNAGAFGSGLVPPGTGFVLQNRAGGFTLKPDRPNTLRPRTRPLHTIIPAFMQRGDERIAFGIMGGFNQAQAHAQFVSNVVDFASIELRYRFFQHVVFKQHLEFSAVPLPANTESLPEQEDYLWGV